MGKKARIKRKRRGEKEPLPEGLWEDANGIHASIFSQESRRRKLGKK